MTRVLPIKSATTPIVKFNVGRSQLQCDVNNNDLGGWYGFRWLFIDRRYNSMLILSYCNIAPHVLRPMIHALKLWAGAHGVNNPSGAGDVPTMSSYCLTLMAIAYLQHLGILPNLQDGIPVPDNLDPSDTSDSSNTIWVGWGRYQGIKANILFKKVPPPGWRSAHPNLTAADAIAGFFGFFSSDMRVHGRFRYNEQVVSVLNGGIMNRVAPTGHESATRATYRRTLNGMEEVEIKRLMELYDDEWNRKNDVSRMGTGNSGIQPKPWGEKRLVVQDPFIWEKVGSDEN